MYVYVIFIMQHFIDEGALNESGDKMYKCAIIYSAEIWSRLIPAYSFCLILLCPLALMSYTYGNTVVTLYKSIKTQAAMKEGG